MLRLVSRLFSRALLGSIAVLSFGLSACEGDCVAADKEGARRGESLRTGGGVPFEVVTPWRYSHRSHHGLVVAYAGSGGSISSILDSWGLVEAAGDVVIAAVAEQAPTSEATLSDLGSVRSLVEERYCIAPERIALTGHSDGGSTAALVALLPVGEGLAGVAPSAAGVRPSDLEALGCARALSVLVLHSEDDDVFPDRGEASAGWWSDCFSCTDEVIDEGCVVRSGCSGGSSVRFCPGTGSHSDWPEERAADIIAIVNPPE